MFEEDLKKWKKAEHEFAALLLRMWVIIWWEEPQWKFSDYDMKLKTVGGEYTVEVKRDERRPSTKKIWIEFADGNKPSWISVSKADYYVYNLGEDFWSASRSKLLSLLFTTTNKELCKWWDSWEVLLWVIPEEEFYSIAKKVWKN